MQAQYLSSLQHSGLNQVVFPPGYLELHVKVTSDDLSQKSHSAL